MRHEPTSRVPARGLGFIAVFDYVPGKIDWLAHNLPTHGTLAEQPTAGTRLRSDVPIAGPDKLLRVVRARVETSRYRLALVTAPDGTLLGRLRQDVVNGDPEQTAGAAAEPGPSTIRPHQPVQETSEQLQAHDLSYAIVTDPDGHLLDTVHRPRSRPGVR